MEARALLAICVLVTILAALLYHLTWAKPWMPGIAVGSLTIGLTATFVQALLTRAQRRAESERVAPVLGVALRATSESVYYFLLSMANSWMHSNLGAFRSDLPGDVNAWMELLVYEFPNSDEQDPLLRAGISPVLLATGLKQSLDAVVARDSDVLLQERPELLSAINDFHDEMEVVERQAQLARLNVASPAELHLSEAMRRSLMAVRDFVEVYTRTGPLIAPELIQSLNCDLAERHAERVRAG